MNRDTSIIQATVLVLIIAVLGVAIRDKQQPNLLRTESVNEQAEQQDQPKTRNTDSVSGVVFTETGDDTVVTVPTPPQELVDSPHANLIKQYFLDLANNDYTSACGRLSPAKCTPVQEVAVANFSQEHKKLSNGYEYVSVKDFGLTSPSGKHVTCVKYSYRYIDDTNPQLISEVLSFYTDTMEDGSLKITDRVCEKKYKDGSGERPCPIQAKQVFCEGKIK